MSWGNEFAKLCLDHKVCLHGWPDVKHVPGVPGENGLKEASALPVPSGRKILKARIRFWQSLSAEDAVDEEEPLLEDDLVRFVPWDDDLADIPIVRGVPDLDNEEGHPLCLLKQSKLYRLRVQARGMDLNNTDSEDNNNDDENQHEEGMREYPPRKVEKLIRSGILERGFLFLVSKRLHHGEQLKRAALIARIVTPMMEINTRERRMRETTKALDARIHASETRGGEGRASGLSAEEERVLRIALTKLNQSAEDRLSNGGGTGEGEMGKAEQRKGKKSGAGATEVPRKKTKVGDRAEKPTNIRPVKWRRHGEGRQERQN
ncbi:hypothetical protein DFJ43DRAFT_1042515 [Lentinula guzmanii]|uniref:Uncharacterized protein n=1 Tax=Lentinula guzmanii TaxID=2804957 RepID=A0AA38J9H3_9AGAR|nr:hypothetical protein DFJ43DRAFT_1042515 [Lentinula guzmanii]